MPESIFHSYNGYESKILLNLTPHCGNLTNFLIDNHHNMQVYFSKVLDGSIYCIYIFEV